MDLDPEKSNKEELESIIELGFSLFTLILHFIDLDIEEKEIDLHSEVSDIK